MVRLKIEIPEKKPVFITSYKVIISDLNYGNHVGNDKVLSIVHEARLAFLKSHSQTELDFFGFGLIMTEAQVQYIGQMFWNEELNVSLFFGEINLPFFEIFYLVESGGKTKAKIKTAMCLFDYDTQKIAKPSEEFQKSTRYLFDY